MHCREEIGHTQEEAERDKVGSIRLELGARQLARVLGSASTALVKSGKGRVARTSRQQTASAWPQFPHLSHLSTPTSAPSSGQIRRAGSVRTNPRILGMFPLRPLFRATWSSWFPRAPTAIWHTFLAVLSHPVAGDGDIVVAQTDCPATTL